MGLICPECRKNTLKIESQIMLPPDNRSDEISVQIIKCSSCSLEGVAIYEESRRGALNYESINHRGYYVSPNFFTELEKKILECPNPRNSSCLCKTHSQLKKKEKSGNWSWIHNLDGCRSFRIQFTSSREHV